MDLVSIAQQELIRERLSTVREGGIDVTGARIVELDDVDGTTVLVTVLLSAQGAEFAPEDFLGVRSRVREIITAVLGDMEALEIVYEDTAPSDAEQPDGENDKRVEGQG